jgi:fatty-acyl-CoA synthase
LARWAQQGERVGTLAWNGYRHLEIYYGVSGMGAVCHTINPRLFPEQIAYIVNHADDSTCSSMHVPAAGGGRGAALPEREGLGDDVRPRAHAGRVEGRPALLRRPDRRAGRRLPGRSSTRTPASSLCYTSGTTGNPKGALYSHRSTVLHSYASALPDALGCSART